MTAAPTVEMYEKAMSYAVKLFDYDEKQMENAMNSKYFYGRNAEYS